MSSVGTSAAKPFVVSMRKEDAGKRQRIPFAGGCAGGDLVRHLAVVVHRVAIGAAVEQPCAEGGRRALNVHLGDAARRECGEDSARRGVKFASTISETPCMSSSCTITASSSKTAVPSRCDAARAVMPSGSPSVSLNVSFAISGSDEPCA